MLGKASSCWLLHPKYKAIHMLSSPVKTYLPVHASVFPPNNKMQQSVSKVKLWQPYSNE